MFLTRKKKVLDLIETVLQMLDQLFAIRDIEQNVMDCMEAINVIKGQLQMEDKILPNTIAQVKYITTLFVDLIKEKTVVNEQSIQFIIEKIVSLKELFQDEVHIQLNVLFLPYKASMWDSLASIYEVAKKDEDCVAKVVPIPYYKLGDGAEVPAYEGDLFPEDVPVIHYNSYNFEEELPDIIYVHNIYDQYNKVVRVHEFFFTKNLKNYTNMLVYVPYHISEPYKLKEEEIRVAYYLPGMKFVDKVVLPGKFVEKEALNNGLPYNKILTLGSPKFDSMIKSLKNEVEYPKEWLKQFDNKTIILLTTSCTFFSNGKFSNKDTFNLYLDIPRYIDDIVILWRPHPLTIQSTRRLRPDMVDTVEAIYEDIRNVKYPWLENFLLDESSDYFPALKVADMLITEGGSLMQSFLLTDKSIMLMGFKEQSIESFLLPGDAFYYFYDSELPWYKLLNKFVTGYDPLKDKRKNLAALVYENVDGSCGEKVYYEIKRCILE